MRARSGMWGLGFTEHQPLRIRRHALKAITRMGIRMRARVVCALHSRCRMRNQPTRRHGMTHCLRVTDALLVVDMPGLLPVVRAVPVHA